MRFYCFMENLIRSFKYALCDPRELRKMRLMLPERTRSGDDRGLLHTHEAYELRAFYPLTEKTFLSGDVQLEIVPAHTAHLTIDNRPGNHLFIGAGGNGALVLHLDEIFILDEDYYIEKLNEKFFNSYGRILETLYKDLYAGGTAYGFNLLAWVFAGLFEVFESWRSAPRRKTSAPARAIAYIKHHYHNPAMNAADVAAFVKLNPSYLSKIFSAEYGRSIISTISEIRLSKARELLMTGRYSVKEVASMTGWSNQLYFSSRYRKHYGVSPIQSKKKLL